jgi:hypothetical protein
MQDNPYRYAAEKLGAARRALLAPPPGGDAEAFAGAMMEFDIGMNRLPVSDLDESARGLAATIRGIMSTDGIADPTGRGTINIRASQLTSDEKRQLAHAIDDLADWLERRSQERDAK